MADAVAITATEFDVAWEDLGLGPTPAVLRLPSPGRTEGERRRIRAAARATLDGRAADLLASLARPTERLELRVRGRHEVRALAATGSRRVLAVHRADTVTLSCCDSLPDALLGVLPAAPPGTGAACTAPTAVIARALRAPDVRRSLIDRDVPATDAGLLARMLTAGPRTAQIAAAGTVTVHDGPGGRYLITHSTAEDGVGWTTVAPVDARGLRHRVGSLLDGGAGSPP